MAKTTFTFRPPGAKEQSAALAEMLDALAGLVEAASSLATVADLVGRTADAHLEEVPEVLVYPLAFLVTAREAYASEAVAYVERAEAYLDWKEEK